MISKYPNLVVLADEVVISDIEKFFLDLLLSFICLMLIIFFKFSSLTLFACILVCNYSLWHFAPSSLLRLVITDLSFSFHLLRNSSHVFQMQLEIKYVFLTFEITLI